MSEKQNWFHKYGQDEVITPEDYARLPLKYRDRFGPTPAHVTRHNARYGLNNKGELVLLEHGEPDISTTAQQQQFQGKPIQWVGMRKAEEERLEALIPKTDDDGPIYQSAVTDDNDSNDDGQKGDVSETPGIPGIPG